MSRWIIVSNRLPFSYDPKQKKVSTASGGLVTAIKGIKTNNEILWVGTLPEGMPEKELKKVKKDKNITYAGIKLDKDLYDSYYNKFSNDVLWPALHYELNRVRYEQDHLEDYRKVNKIFCQKILKLAKKNDLIWVHDYHLFLLPGYLKKKLNKTNKIGFFLHVPFPSSEMYRQLTPRREILTELIKADLIGFHDFSYLRHFSRTVYDIIGLTTTQMEIKGEGVHAKLGVFPVSIPTKDLIKNGQTKKTQAEIKRINLKGNKKMHYLLGVDRLDYTKGIPQKLDAYEHFLETNPSYQGRVQLIQIAVPTRTEVEEYVELRQEVEQKVGAINGKYAKINYTPIKYINRSVSLNELLALYRSTDALFVTSLRDGMNLVCLEYVVSQEDKSSGVVLLSEFAGAKATLSHALSINPHNLEKTSLKIKMALEMPKEEKNKRNSIMKNYLLGYDSSHWAEDFMNSLDNIKIEKDHFSKNLDHFTHLQMVKKRAKNQKNILFIDFDGTLSPIVNDPEKAMMSNETREVLKKLSVKNNTELIIVSGRPKDFLMKKLKGIKCHMAFEHGAQFFDKDQQKVRNLVLSSKEKWFSKAIKIMENYQKRTPDSFIEKKNYAIAWHYRNSPADYAEFQAKNLVSDLRSYFQGISVSVISGKKVVEIKAEEANKGRFVEWFLERYSEGEDHVFTAGDDRTDEDMFKVVMNKGTSLKIGKDSKTNAAFYIEHQEDFSKYLHKLFL